MGCRLSTAVVDRTGFFGPNPTHVRPMSTPSSNLRSP
ncbi:hypothetical protein A2U01_0048812, partial [Trifolium medium]|nr:hypothetical protein [Trifolium medium]